MVKVFNGTDKEFYMDGFHKENLDTASKVIVKDWDMVFVYDGGEGSGKSTKAIQDAFYCDPTLTLDRIVFTPYEFKKAVLTATQYQSVVYDEAYTGLSSRATMSLINRTLISMLAEIRQRNLFVFVVMPTFFDLDKYVALWRSRALIHIYTGKSFERGYFAFYNVDLKKDLYINGKKYYSYGKPKPNFTGRFTSFFPLNHEEYKKKKASALIAREQIKEEAEMKRQMEERIFNKMQLLREENPDKWTHQIIIDVTGIAPATYYRKLKTLDLNKEFTQ
jgi:hypothetical protein